MFADACPKLRIGGYKVIIELPYIPISGKSITVLAVSASTEELTALGSIFSGAKWICHRVSSIREGANWTLHTVSSIKEAISWMKRGSIPVIICGCELPDGTWQTLMREIEDHARPPRVIVSSRLADDRLWAEVLNLGGHDVLATPFEAREVLHSVRSACDSWHNQWGTHPKLVVARRAAGTGSDLPPAA